MLHFPVHIRAQHTEFFFPCRLRTTLNDRLIFNRNRHNIRIRRRLLAQPVIQMCQCLPIAVYQPVHPQCLQNIGIRLLLRLHRLALHHRILDMIIEKPRWNHRFIRVFPPDLLHRRIHVDDQLQLQSIINIRQVKFRFSRLVINDLKIQPVAILAEIDSVNPPAQMDRLLA